MEQSYEDTGDLEITEDYIVFDEAGAASNVSGQLDLSGLRKRKTKIISSAKETIENASRLIRRRVPAAGHLMTPRRLWLNKIPTQCDVVIEFPENVPDETMRWLLNKIRSPYPEGLGLQCLVRSHESTKRTAFYISAPMNILFKAAEDFRLPKRLRSDLGGTLKDFTTRESHYFEQIKDEDGKITLFTSQERQWLVFQVLQGLRATSSDVTQFQSSRERVDEGQSIIAAWQDSGLIEQVFPLHETNALTQLKSNWVRKFFAPQPLDDIASYFGVKVALYFAWLGHYTCALCVPAVFGSFLWIILYGRGQTAKDIGHVLFSLFNVSWASLYLEAWRRYSSELAFRWGTLSVPPELLEPPRPLYKGPLELSTVTCKLEPKEAPAWKRRAFRYLVSFPIIGLCLCSVFIVMFIILRLQDWTDRKLPESGVISYLSVIPKVLLAAVITVMDEFYYKLAVWLNDKENYREQSKYDNHLIGKVALFQFVNSFLSLFYIAFYLRDQDLLKEQLAGLLISRQIIGNLRESAWPYFMEQWRMAMISFKLWGEMSPTKDSAAMPSTKSDNERTESKEEINAESDRPKQQPAQSTKRCIGQAEIESSYFKYDGTFEDHMEMLIQMGYVVLFSSAFPLAGLCALANNLLEIRSDAFKLAHVHQRPFGQRVANIGTWQNAFSLLGLAAVIVNCALIGLSGQVSRLWPGLTQTQTVILIVALEHIMLGLRSVLKYILPELPEWLAAEIARAEHCRREMQCKGASPRATPPSPHSSTSMSQDQSTPDIFEKAQQVNIDPDDNVFERLTPSSPKIFDEPHRDIMFSHVQKRTSRGSGSGSVDHHSIAEGALDSPISQTSTVLCLRPLHDPAAQTSLDSEQQNSGPSSPASSSSQIISKPKSSLTSSQPIQIPVIPPFKKRYNQISNYPFPPASSNSNSSNTQSTSVSPPKHSDLSIIQQKPRKSKDFVQETQGSLDNPSFAGHSTSSHPDHQITIGSHGAEWTKRLKVAEQSPIHRSTDCIVSKDLGTSSDSELLKPAPSWTNIAAKSIEQHASASASAPSVPEKMTSEEEQRAAEIAAKKSRLKQKLIKSARSVAVFSLKLKERRAREAERVAKEKAEEEAQEKAMMIGAMCGGGGELNLIPLENLIRIEDVSDSGRRSSSNTLQNSSNSGSGM